jgi:hypothetical protein
VDGVEAVKGEDSGIGEPVVLTWQQRAFDAKIQSGVGCKDAK